MKVTKLKTFDRKSIDYSWSFVNKTQKDTSYITHSYYTYPAKFIPQLASRLINLYSKPLDIIIDPFMGSGTTMVESLINNRLCIGVDINEIAYLVAKVKTMPLNLNLLYKEYNQIRQTLNFNNNQSLLNFQAKEEEEDLLKKAEQVIPNNEKIDYWFKSKQKKELSVILYSIFQIENKDIKDFFLVAFAQILKTASIWLQKSIKPTRDKNKKETDCYILFLNQVEKMIQKHQQYNTMLNDKILTNPDVYINISCGDSRFLPIEESKGNLIITSPPYVTSYEYADLHQLPSLWFGFLDSLSEFRKKFIGSSSKERIDIDIKSNLAQNIINQLENKKAKEVKNYYADMLESFIEMNRVLKPKGKACIVIGNTKFKGIDILNAEVFAEQMQNIGFRIFDIIHREIPSKMLPSTRDSKTGRFAKVSQMDKLVYPTEYILIMEKI